MSNYKAAAGFAKDELNAAPPTIARGAKADRLATESQRKSPVSEEFVA
jgi:hypothetical protein